MFIQTVTLWDWYENWRETWCLLQEQEHVFETKQARMSIANIIVTINNSSGVEQKMFRYAEDTFVSYKY